MIAQTQSVATCRCAGNPCVFALARKVHNCAAAVAAAVAAAANTFRARVRARCTNSLNPVQFFVVVVVAPAPAGRTEKKWHPI